MSQSGQHTFNCHNFAWPFNMAWKFLTLCPGDCVAWPIRILCTNLLSTMTAKVLTAVVRSDSELRQAHKVRMRMGGRGGRVLESLGKPVTNSCRDWLDIWFSSAGGPYIRPGNNITPVLGMEIPAWLTWEGRWTGVESPPLLRPSWVSSSPMKTAFSYINAVEAAYRRHSSVSSSSSSVVARLFTSIALSSDVSGASLKSVSTGSPGSFSLGPSVSFLAREQCQNCTRGSFPSSSGASCSEYWRVTCRSRRWGGDCGPWQQWQGSYFGIYLDTW